MEKKKIINIGVIAHVDAGKSTLVDALLNQTGVFRENEEVRDCIMDSDDLERERGITIYSKNCAIEYEDVKINILDTPGHSDFSSEVERVIKAVDSVILLVDATDGPMPQTRFVLKKALEKGIKPIVFINKIDKKNQRAVKVADMVLDLFIDLGASDEQLDFPVLYGIATEGIARHELDGKSDDLSPLFDTILTNVEPYPDLTDRPLQLQIYDLAYDDYLGRIGIGRVYRGEIENRQKVTVSRRNGEIDTGEITKLFVYKGLNQIPVEKAISGDIVAVAGIEDISIGETISDRGQCDPLPMIEIAKPTMSMYFMVNDSPYAGQEGDYLTTRHLKARLERELEVNVGLEVVKTEKEDLDAFKVSGRGQLHLSILLENMRREGYELSVSRPEVLLKEENGQQLEPLERAAIEVPEEYSGTVIEKLNQRKGIMQTMKSLNDYVHLEFLIPTRGLIGFRSDFLNDTRGEGTMIRSFAEYGEYRGDIPGRNSGVLISKTRGEATAYALSSLQQHGTFFIKPGTRVYEGMIIGTNKRNEDLTVNPCKGKQLTNVRAAGSDEAYNLPPALELTLEEAIEFIDNDELVEITPRAIRLRKKILNEKKRIRRDKHKV
ncbi:MAG: translational GTPase TypA [Halanaerobiales bacterium]